MLPPSQHPIVPAAAVDDVEAGRTIALRATLGPDRLGRLVEVCLHRLAALSSDLRDPNLDGDLGSLLKRLHTLHGSCASLGLASLADATRRIQGEISGAPEAGLAAAARTGADDIDRLGRRVTARLAADPRLGFATDPLTTAS